MRLGIVGASGYAGLELLRLLAVRSGDEVTIITSRQEAGEPLTKIFPHLSKIANYDKLKFVAPADLAGQADVFFLAAQHGVAMEIAPKLLQKGARVIDLSADFRLKSPELFRKWYGEHKAVELLSQSVYGLPELYAEKIKSASLVANPGCYPTSVILALAPVVEKGILDSSQVIVADSKSGVTGAGRGALLSNSFCEVQDNFKSYKTVGHRHTPEIVQELSSISGETVQLAFTPHLLPIGRGILSTVYFKLNQTPSLESLFDLYSEFYKSAKFVRVRPLDHAPQTADVRGTNFCDLAIFHDPESSLYKVVSVIDNLCRGAGGQAVANLNIMTGHSEDYCLVQAPLRP